MPIKDLFSNLILLRRLSASTTRIADALEAQNQFLARLADRYAPETLPTPTAADLKHTGPTFSRDTELVRIQEFVERCQRDLHREPTDEEIVDYLDGVEVSL